MVSWLAAVVMMLSQGNATDVLDLVDTAAYWQAEKVETTVQALGPQLKADAAMGRAGAVRRLMAIRALGERKDKAALPLLAPLANDPSPFVADYARQAIALIEGKAYRRPGPSAEKLAADVALLPSGCGLVAQTSTSGGAPVSYDALAEILKATTPPGGPAQDPDEVRAKVTEALAKFTGVTGNFRVEGLTVGVAGEMGPRTGFVVVVARGLYDADAVAEALAAAAKKDVEEIEGVPVIHADRSMALAFPSNDRAILVAGPAREGMDAALAQVLAALKTGKGGIAGDAEMQKLLASVDRAKRLWAAATMTDTYREAPVFAPFDTMTLAAQDKDGAMQFTVVARGKDADAVRKAVDTFEAGRQDALVQMKKSMPAEAKAMLGGIVEMIEGVKTTQDGATATLSASLKGGANGGMMLPFFWMMAGHETRQVTARAEMDRARAEAQAQADAARARAEADRARMEAARAEAERARIAATQRAAEARRAAENAPPPTEERVLFDFEADAINRDWYSVDHNTAAAVEDARAHGKRWLEVDASPEGQWPGIFHRLPPDVYYPAWRGIRFSVFNPGDEAFQLSVSAWDDKSNSYDTRFNNDEGVTVKPGANEFDLTWGALRIGTSPSRGVDVNSLRYFVIFVSAPKKVITYYVDNVRLVPALPKGGPTQMLADFDGGGAAKWKALREGSGAVVKRPDGAAGSALKVSFPNGQQYAGVELSGMDADWLSWDILAADVVCPKGEETPRNVFFKVVAADGTSAWLCTGLEKGLNRLRVPLELAGFASLGRVSRLEFFLDYAPKASAIYLDNVRLERAERLAGGPPVLPTAGTGEQLRVAFEELGIEDKGAGYGAVVWVPLDDGRTRVLHCTSSARGVSTYRLDDAELAGRKADAPVEVWGWVRSRKCWYWTRESVALKNGPETVSFGDAGRFGF